MAAAAMGASYVAGTVASAFLAPVVGTALTTGLVASGLYAGYQGY